MERILCPYHEEDTPSFTIYPDGTGHCFGCGVHVPEYKPAAPGDTVVYAQVEDLKAKYAYIDSLPKREIRGLQLPFDEDGYYITWPDKKYYKLRRYHAAQSGKYLSPKGVTKTPWMTFYYSSTLVAIEGELNAMSLEEAYNRGGECGPTIMSLGGAGDFYSKATERMIGTFKRFDTILIVTDCDKAGATAAIKFKELLMPLRKNVAIHLMRQDANEILVEHGPEKLKEEIEKVLKTLGVRSGL